MEWADEGGRGGVCLAMVARQEMIDQQKFGVTVAANRGLVSNIFTTEPRPALARRPVTGTVTTS